LTASSSPLDRREHFSHCVQVFGGPSAASRRLDIDQRAIRRFTSGELPISDSLLADTAKALRALIEEATAAEAAISEA
jgi:hypothetical protein